MAKDYAKQTRYSFVVSEGSSGKRRWELFFVFLFIAVICGVLLFAIEKKAYRIISNSPGISAFAARTKSWFVRPRQNAQTAASAAAAAAQPDEPVRFDFYTELPNAQIESNTVVDSTDANKAAKKLQETVRKSGLTPPAPGYVVKIAAYVSESQAGQMRISLLLAGVDADIVKMKEGNKDMFRVQQGPYATVKLAKKRQQELQKKGIESAVEKIE